MAETAQVRAWRWHMAIAKARLDHVRSLDVSTHFVREALSVEAAAHVAMAAELRASGEAAHRFAEANYGEDE